MDVLDARIHDTIAFYWKDLTYIVIIKVYFYYGLKVNYIAIIN